MSKVFRPKVWAIIPVYNRLDFTKKCLSSFFNQTYKNFVVVLIDDGSTDGTWEYVTKHFPKVKIIKGNGNWWWTRSMYEGVKYVLREAAKNDYVLEMNNDCFFGREYLRNLLAYAQKNPKTIVGSLNITSDRPYRVVEAGVRIDWSQGRVYGLNKTLSNKISYYKKIKEVKNIDALPGKGTLIPVEVFRKIGNFNYQKLPHYIADYEFSNRAKRKGYELKVATNAIVKHHWKETGIYSKNSNRGKSIKHAIDLLFGRKSMNNIIDLYNFVNLSSPRKYLFVNYLFLVLKVCKGALSVKPLNRLRPMIKYVEIVIDIFRRPKVFFKNVKKYFKKRVGFLFN